MLATTAIGAIWAVCSPDFGVRGALTGWRLWARSCCCAWMGTDTAARLLTAEQKCARSPLGMEGLQHVIHVPYLHLTTPGRPRSRRCCGTRC